MPFYIFVSEVRQKSRVVNACSASCWRTIEDLRGAFARLLQVSVAPCLADIVRKQRPTSPVRCSEQLTSLLSRSHTRFVSSAALPSVLLTLNPQLSQQSATMPADAPAIGIDLGTTYSCVPAGAWGLCGGDRLVQPSPRKLLLLRPPHACQRQQHRLSGPPGACTGLVNAFYCLLRPGGCARLQRMRGVCPSPRTPNPPPH